MPFHLFMYLAGWIARPCLLAWLYAFYCFDYSWATTGVSVQRRIRMFEADWPFYLGMYGVVL